MKKYLIIISLLAVSCASDETYCFECKEHKDGKITEFTRCDITQEEADDIARAGTVIKEDGGNSFIVWSEKYTICSRVDK